MGNNGEPVATARPRLFVVVSLSVIFGLYLVYLYSTVIVMIGMRAPRPPTITQNLPQADFALFWYSGKWLTWNVVNTLGVHLRPSQDMLFFQNNVVDSLQPFQLGWLYPPVMGLLALLYSFLPLAIGFWAWRMIFFVIASFLLRQAGLGWPAIIMGLVGPAEMQDTLGGQNGVLTGGLLVSALLLVDRKPGPSGIIAGFLALKPQLGLALPFVLLRRRRWPALISCCICLAVLVLLTLPVEGLHSWAWFFSGARHRSINLLSTSFKDNFQPNGASVFYMARSLNLSLHITWLLQFVTSAISALLIWRVWRDPAYDPVPRMAFTISLWITLTPYAYFYDLVGYSVAMAAMFMKVEDRLKPLFGCLWLFAGYTLTVANKTGIIFMPMAAVVGAWLIWWLGRRSHPDWALQI